MSAYERLESVRNARFSLKEMMDLVTEAQCELIRVINNAPADPEVGNLTCEIEGNLDDVRMDAETLDELLVDEEDGLAEKAHKEKQDEILYLENEYRRATKLEGGRK
jgi:hypothetical protein